MLPWFTGVSLILRGKSSCFSNFNHRRIGYSYTCRRLDFPTRRGHLIAALVQAKTSLNAEKMLMQPRSELELIIEESEVAEVQAEVLQALERNRPDAITEDELQQLNQRFMDISEVGVYIDPFP